MNKNLWLFIDIDGCIMPNMFSKGFYTNNREKIESIIDTYHNAKEASIYFEFFEWFKRITSNKEYEIFEITFISGRQENCFGWLTNMQLKPLEKFRGFDVRYFYNHAKHTWDIYKSFKVNSILDALNFSNYRGMIKIYDDYDLEHDFKQALDKEFEFNLIRQKEDWNLL
ncbi:MAG: hypothetical protein ACFFG0_04840 [Candidatus Thorarchaeota archaeon]